ncbi:hypothetical protein BCV70DRAFT_202911 [Testicularia cyperi]|uniref:LamG-like jellyroll fold domain-containing protein n=1 Tax=Testicularia cyperi TaxID=1882483 RepID=A0A317XHW0_9BASI|nr:hypothetical protein BCV70DRAFT_202911 [Testicularia cyperi]
MSTPIPVINEDKDPNQTSFAAKDGRYVNSRLVIHNGQTISIALRLTQDRKPIFEYAFLDATVAQKSSGKTTNTGRNKKAAASSEPAKRDQLDSQGWTEKPKLLTFVDEIRVVGQEAIPVYKIPPVDNTGRYTTSQDKSKLNLWLSTTACLTEPSITDFQVISDGKHVFLFRQALDPKKMAAIPNHEMLSRGLPPVDCNLLCDRFILVDKTLQRPLEVRYRRSRQKRLPLNDKDTLAVKDINDTPFYEPTFSLDFIRPYMGRFTVLRTPTVINNVNRWLFFCLNKSSFQLDCFSTDTAQDGLFDLHGHLYYKCESKDHDEIYETSPGACIATNKTESKECGKPKTPIVPQSPFSDRSVALGGADTGAYLSTAFGTLDFSTSAFASGFTLEAWIKPDKDRKVGEISTIFGFAKSSPFSIAIDPNHCLAFLMHDNKRTLARPSTESLKLGEWNHIAVVYDNRQQHNCTFVINGVQDPGAPPAFLTSSTPFKFSYIGNNPEIDGAATLFCGAVDEVRIWRHALPLDTIEASKASRAIGTEDLLSACWHFDEGSGKKVYDATANNYSLDLCSKQDPDVALLWQASHAPLVNNVGLTRRTLRLPSDVSITGGISVNTYYEQVTVLSQGITQDSTASDKPLKRAARVLLCAVASVSGVQIDSTLLMLDFALLANGTLCDTPGIIPTPKLTLTRDSTSGKAYIPTSLLYVDPAGMEVFGGLIQSEQCRSNLDSPCVWESATGSVTVFFRHQNGMLAALPYDITRTIVATPPAGLGEHKGLLAVSKLRGASSITLRTSPSALFPTNIAIDVSIEATMLDKRKITETWTAMPVAKAEFCSYLNGTGFPVTRTGIQTFKDVQPLPSLANGTGTALANGGSLLILDGPIELDIAAASCIAVGTARMQVLLTASVGDTSLHVSVPYVGTLSRQDKGAQIDFLGYDTEELPSCKGKPSGDFRRGSSILGLSTSSSAATDAQSDEAEVQPQLISSNVVILLQGSGQVPTFSSPPQSRSLHLKEDTVYSMLGNAREMEPCSGLTYECWVKPTTLNQRDTVLTAYTSQHLARSEKTGKEQQTFVLSIPGTAGDSYSLQGNVNGRLFKLKGQEALLRDSLKLNRWAHVAVSYHNAYSLRFDGTNYVDCGTAAGLNASDMTMIFTLQFESSPNKQLILSKASANGSTTPYELNILPGGHLEWTMFGKLVENYTESGSPITSDTQRLTFQTSSQMQPNEAYKVFISRKAIMVPVKDKSPRHGIQFSVSIWNTSGQLVCRMTPSSIQSLETATNQEQMLGGSATSTRKWTSIEGSKAPLVLGGASWNSGGGLRGYIGALRIYASAVAVPENLAAIRALDGSEGSMLAFYSFEDAQGQVLLDSTGQSDGKLKLDPIWAVSPFIPDAELFVLVNGQEVALTQATATEAILQPIGPHQLTLGNVIQGDEGTRALALFDNFVGQIDELRIWNTRRTLESICDTLYSRLTDIPDDMAAYFPFDDPVGNTADQQTSLLDVSSNSWHLTPLHGAACMTGVSDAPVGIDAPCVYHSLAITENGVGAVLGGSMTVSSPSVVEYGDVQIAPTGSMEGSYKRAYTYVDSANRWRLVTGFKIGSLLTQWVSQVQTAPTLIGYIEGAPPVPAENYLNSDDKPTTSVAFKNAESCTYSYSSSKDQGNEVDLNTSAGLGAEWDVEGGIGITSTITKGKIVGKVNTSLNVSNSQVNNSVSSFTSNTDLEMRVGITGSFTKNANQESQKQDQYTPANMGIALVESETTDVFALRLKTRGSVMPLVAYQMRPNPDIPKDRNLVPFQINAGYTKQGCLDGRRGLNSDPDYQDTASAPKDASYFKPIEAYAFKDRIRRQEEQLEGDWQQYSIGAALISDAIKEYIGLDLGVDVPRRTKRNICNSYVWTAHGGTYQETHSSMDLVQTEVGGSYGVTSGLGGSFEAEVNIAGVLVTGNVDAMVSTHYNVSMAKTKESESSFELEVEMPDAVDIREEKGGKMVKRPGAVDAYRWMSFWLEPSVEATDVFFQKVVDPTWLQDPSDSNARVLQELQTSLAQEQSNARTKAWRVMHRVTYVSRVPSEIATKPTAPIAAGNSESKLKKSILDFSSSWMIIKRLEPYVRPCKTRNQVAQVIGGADISHFYPTLRSNPKYWNQIVELLADYIGVSS